MSHNTNGLRHIQHKLDEAGYFLSGMQHFESELAGIVGLNGNAFTTPGAYHNVRQFQFHFSAMLNAWKTVNNYVRTRCEIPKGSPAEAWVLEKSKLPHIEAFNKLRNSDAHWAVAEPAHRTKITPFAEDPGVANIERSLVLNRKELGESPHLVGRPDLVNALTSRPLLAVSKAALTELVEVVFEGRDRHFLQ